MRPLILFAALVLPSCATVAPEAPPPLAQRDESAPSWSAAETRALVERDAAALLGEEAIAEVRRASSSVLVRRPIQFPRMTRLPDGSWQAEPPQMAAAVRTSHGWVGWSGGRRFGFDAPASRELNRLVSSRELWAEPLLGETGCTDAAGIGSVVRHQGRTRAATQPCGAIGLTGQLAAIVLAGQVTDWSGVPPAERPAGIDVRRFHPQTEQYFQFAGGLRDPVNLVVRDGRAWEAMWRRITVNHGEPPPRPEVLFDREMLLIAAMGAQPSGGYRVRIERVLDVGDALEAHVIRTSPGPRCGAIAAITHPVDIVRVAASGKPVRWLLRQDATDCP
jgi:hypothetical protein